MKQYECYELRLNGPEPADHARVDVDGSFEMNGTVTAVKGFYAGDGIYIVRYLPTEAGLCRYRVTGMVNAEGEIVCEAAADSVHGLVRAEGTHFRHEDGTYFYPFGTTVYALIHQEDALMAETMESLKAAPFNKIRFCVFPKHYDFNHNEPPFYAFEKKQDGGWDVTRPCFAFWDRLETVLVQLGKMGIQGDLILFHPYDRWGFADMPQADNLIYLAYLLRRLAAFPNVWWSLANEYDLCGAKSVADWEEIETFVAEHDPYHHLLSNHNCFKNWDFTRPNVTHACIQTKALYKVSEWRRQYNKPVVIDECCYEGNIQHVWGSISGREMTNRFWRVVTMGGYCTHGETFLETGAALGSAEALRGEDVHEEILWWSRGGRLKGESPARIAFLRGIVEELPGPVEPTANWIMEILQLPPDEKERRMEQAGTFVRAMLQMGDELKEFCASEFTYQGRCGEEAYLTFYDMRTCAKDVLELPETDTYRVELIDTWNMTRTVLSEHASGKTALSLPGREGMAVLAVKNREDR